MEMEIIMEDIRMKLTEYRTLSKSSKTDFVKSKTLCLEGWKLICFV
jgi:hypothetical protein